MRELQVGLGRGRRLTPGPAGIRGLVSGACRQPDSTGAINLSDFPASNGWSSCSTRPSPRPTAEPLIRPGRTVLVAADLNTWHRRHPMPAKTLATPPSCSAEPGVRPMPAPWVLERGGIPDKSALGARVLDETVPTKQLLVGPANPADVTGAAMARQGFQSWLPFRLSRRLRLFAQPRVASAVTV
jgi:hypothetical protein